MEIDRLSIGADEGEMEGLTHQKTQKTKKKKVAHPITDGPAMRTRKSLAQHLSKLPRK